MWQPDLEYFAWVYLFSDGYLYGFCIMWFRVANLIRKKKLLFAIGLFFLVRVIH